MKTLLQLLVVNFVLCNAFLAFAQQHEEITFVNSGYHKVALAIAHEEPRRYFNVDGWIEIDPKDVRTSMRIKTELLPKGWDVWYAVFMNGRPKPQVVPKALPTNFFWVHPTLKFWGQGDGYISKDGVVNTVAVGDYGNKRFGNPQWRHITPNQLRAAIPQMQTQLQKEGWIKARFYKIPRGKDTIVIQ